MGFPSPASPFRRSLGVFQDLCQAVRSSPRPGHQEAGELSLGGILYPLQDKGRSQVREGRRSLPLGSTSPAPPPLDPAVRTPIPSASSHHHRSGGGGQGCQFQSLRGEESWGLGHLPSAFAREGREHFPGVPGANSGFGLILCPEALGNCHVSEHAGRGQIPQTAMLNFPREEEAGSPGSWVPA